MIVCKLRMLPVECVVRGYITGSGWKDYQATRQRLGHRAAARPARVRAPARRRSSPRRPRPTRATTRRSTSTAPPSWWATATLMARVRDVSIELYRFAAEHARERGVILADTKFEFGLDDDGELVVGDEVLTPDSSRYWPADGYEPGHGQPSFDKQYVRDWAAGSGWDKTPPAPAIPDDVVAGHARALRRGLRAHHRRAVRRVAGAGRRREGARPHPPQGRDPRPAGHRGRARAARARASRACRNVHVGRLVELDVEDAAQLDDDVPSGCWPTR